MADTGTAIVTGAAGLIGRELCAQLATLGRSIIRIDPELARSGEARYDIPATVRQAVLSPLSECLTVREIYHCAGIVGPTKVVTSHFEMMSDHAADAIAVCEWADELQQQWELRGRVRVMLLSSSEVYGLSTKVPQCEDDPVTLGTEAMRWGYAASKLYIEQVGKAYANDRGVHTVIPRLFNVTGPRQRRGFVVPDFVQAALDGEDIVIDGDGFQTRCFSHVSDVARVLIALMSDGTCAAPGTVVNVGSDVPRTILSVADDCVRHAHREPRSKVRCIQRSSHDQVARGQMRTRKPSLDRLRSFVPSAEFRPWEEILSEMFSEARRKRECKS